MLQSKSYIPEQKKHLHGPMCALHIMHYKCGNGGEQLTAAKLFALGTEFESTCKHAPTRTCAHNHYCFDSSFSPSPSLVRLDCIQMCSLSAPLSPYFSHSPNFPFQAARILAQKTFPRVSPIFVAVFPLKTKERNNSQLSRILIRAFHLERRESDGNMLNEMSASVRPSSFRNSVSHLIKYV